MSIKFSKNKEDFVCENCGREVAGSGFTNHCSSCLWSKHVDINPGDRQSMCHGLMEPKSVFQKNGEYSIVHVCKKCELKKPNKISKEDDFDEIIRLSKIY